MSGKSETVWDCAQFREELDLTLKKLRDPENYRTMCFDFWKDGKVQVHGVWVRRHPPYLYGATTGTATHAMSPAGRRRSSRRTYGSLNPTPPQYRFATIDDTLPTLAPPVPPLLSSFQSG